MSEPSIINRELLDILINSEEENVRINDVNKDAIPGVNVSRLYHAAVLSVLKDYKKIKFEACKDA